MPKITFKFAEGHLVKLQEDRPEEAHVLALVPTEFLREYVVWNLRANGDATVDHRHLLVIAIDWYQDELCKELKLYCDAQELPQMSADELVLQQELSDEQRAYLRDYCDRWDDMVELYYVCQRA